MNKDFFTRGISEIISEKSLMERLKSGKKLRIKYGVDPTRPDIHLGHAVSMWKLKELQDAGHIIIFLIGDYTTKIGDPSGRSTTRPMLSDEEIKDNAKTYFDQVGKILDVKKTEIRYNSEWFSKMHFNDVLQIAGKFTVANIIERDDFAKRLKGGIDVGLHEVLYPIMQAYDSVVLNADIEMGGGDQKFNMLAGRELQKKMGQAPQDIILTDLLVGLDGKIKMSKSENNYIGITENATSIFGKTMSLPDTIIEMYFKLCTSISEAEIEKYLKQIEKGENPRNIKMILAEEIASIYCGKTEAEKAKEEFVRVFSKKELPENMIEVKIKGNFSLPVFLVEIEAVSSTSEARRLIVQGAVKIDGVKILDFKAEISAYPGMIVQVGKLKVYKIK